MCVCLCVYLPGFQRAYLFVVVVHVVVEKANNGGLGYKTGKKHKEDPSENRSSQNAFIFVSALAH